MLVDLKDIIHHEGLKEMKKSYFGQDDRIEKDLKERLKDKNRFLDGIDKKTNSPRICTNGGANKARI